MYNFPWIGRKNIEHKKNIPRVPFKKLFQKWQRERPVFRLHSKTAPLLLKYGCSGSYKWPDNSDQVSPEVTSYVLEYDDNGTLIGKKIV